MTAVRRSLLNITRPGARLRVDILVSGRVRLSLDMGMKVHEWEEDTLEDVMLLAATLPEVDAGLYDALMWELDLWGLRGSGG